MFYAIKSMIERLVRSLSLRNLFNVLFVALIAGNGLFAPMYGAQPKPTAKIVGPKPATAKPTPPNFVPQPVSTKPSVAPSQQQSGPKFPEQPSSQSWGQWGWSLLSSFIFNNAAKPDVSTEKNPLLGFNQGLKNLGNTCFSNAVLQALSHCQGFSDAIVAQEEGSFASKLKTVLSQLNTQNKVDQNSLKQLRDVMQKAFELNVNGRQEDASEFLIKLFDCVGDAASSNFRINMHPVPLETISKQTLSYLPDCLDQQEKIAEENNNKFLVISLNRLDPVDEKTFIKHCHVVGFDIDDITISQQRYFLRAVVFHAGQSLNSGHYYTYARSVQNGNWYKYDDDRVTLVIDRSVITAATSALDGGHTSYLLFFEKGNAPVVNHNQQPVVATTSSSASLSTQPAQETTIMKFKANIQEFCECGLHAVNNGIAMLKGYEQGTIWYDNNPDIVTSYNDMIKHLAHIRKNDDKNNLADKELAQLMLSHEYQTIKPLDDCATYYGEQFAIFGDGLTSSKEDFLNFTFIRPLYNNVVPMLEKARACLVSGKPFLVILGMRGHWVAVLLAPKRKYTIYKEDKNCNMTFYADSWKNDAYVKEEDIKNIDAFFRYGTPMLVEKETSSNNNKRPVEVDLTGDDEKNEKPQKRIKKNRGNYE